MTILLSGMLGLRAAWIFGFISTRDYDARCRQKHVGPAALEATDAALDRLEQALSEDRLAVVLILLTILVLAWTYLNGPLVA